MTCANKLLWAVIVIAPTLSAQTPAFEVATAQAAVPGAGTMGIRAGTEQGAVESHRGRDRAAAHGKRTPMNTLRVKGSS